MFDTMADRWTVDSLEQVLVEEEAQISRHRHRQAMLLRLLDAAQVATGDGCRTMGEWVASRLDVAPETAKSLVRLSRASVAHSSDVAAVTAGLEEGSVTFDRTVETVRLAEVGGPVEDSFGWDISSVRRVTARHRRFNRSTEREAYEDRHLVLQPNLSQTSWRLFGQLPGSDGHIVEQALLHQADRFPHHPDGTRVSRAQRNADALAAICQDTITDAGTSESSESSEPSVPLVTVFVDAHLAARTSGEAGVAVAAGPRVGPEVLEELLCEGRVEVTTTGAQPLAAGRTSRVVPPRLRRWILHRDRGCAADACQSRYRLQAHHIIPYSKGGRTDPDNLTTLCWYHHHVVIHGQGFRIDSGSPPQRRRFICPTGSDPPGDPL